MANELSTLVPAAPKVVKGFEVWLSQEDIAAILMRPVRWVRDNLLATGAIKSVLLGDRSYRVDPSVFRKWMSDGCPGFRARPKR